VRSDIPGHGASLACAVSAIRPMRPKTDASRRSAGSSAVQDSQGSQETVTVSQEEKEETHDWPNKVGNLDHMLHHEARPWSMPNATRVLHWNVNGIRARIKDGTFWSAVTDHDVLCLTEFRCTRMTFLQKSGVEARLRELGFVFWAAHCSSGNHGYAGVCVISKRPFDFAETGVNDLSLDIEGRLVLAHFAGFCLAVAYLPNAGKKGNLVQLNRDYKVRGFGSCSGCHDMS
jgi:hypothetical protein